MPANEGVPFEIGTAYKRRSDIHAKFGGQQQGGISTPRSKPFIFVFTGGEGERYGYRDEWDGNGVFRYTGEGQIGDMRFTGGNRAIRDHADNGKDLLLFETQGKSKPVRYIGMFHCADYEVARGKDKKGDPRDIIVFHLVPVGAAPLVAAFQAPPIHAETAVSLAERREIAYAAAKATPSKANATAKRTYWERSAAVRDYVLARADGTCENCGEPAPFLRADGSWYLEPHHIRRLSDGGPDHPAHVAAVCPNCHRELHHGQNTEAKNAELDKDVRGREHELGKACVGPPTALSAIR
jgi:5-methylcytosine-specific restriction enzyme A